jgi:hypothetical protein
MSSMSMRWLGDLRTCFLLEDGWAFRQEVTGFLLEGRGGWRIPLAFAEYIGLADGDYRVLRLPNSELVVTLTRHRGHCSGGPIDAPLDELEAEDGDLLFLQVRRSRGRLLLRRRSERPDRDALSGLLWSCGLDPTAESIRRDPWPRLGRALGGSAAGRDEVRRRLMRRGDERLLALLENAQPASRRSHSDDSTWPYTGRLAVDVTGGVVVEGDDGERRVLLGILDASNRPPRELTLSDGGLLWARGMGSDSDIDAYMSSPPVGLIPSARRRGWCRWLRAEHLLRLSALRDLEWCVERRSDGWATPDGAVATALIDALETAVCDIPAADRPPLTRVRTPYPRTAGAFRALVKDAVDQGLRSLVADPDSGFRAVYSGREISAASLHECLMESV